MAASASSTDRFSKIHEIMMRLGSILALLTFILCHGAVSSISTDIKVISPGKLQNSAAHHGYERLSIYCFSGIPKRLVYFWQTIQLQIIIDGNSWESYVGHTSQDVLQEYEDHHSLWSFNFPFTKKENIFYLNPFNGSCIGIKTTQDHAALVHAIRIDFRRAALFIAGLFLFYSAKRLSTNPIFHYSCGITLGVSTSFLIIIYFASKLLPTKPAVYGFMAGGWAISIYVINLLINNLRTIASVYENYVLGYFFVAALISFAVCYRNGPVTNVRTLALIRWALQSVGLAAIKFSSEFTEAVVVIIVTMLLFYNLPLTSWLYKTWSLRFPPKIKTLTEDEYQQQGIRETKKALEELRKFCSSPECKQWKTVLTLKEPLRFAQFVEAGRHLTETEVLEFDEQISELGFVTDDDGD